MRRKQLFEIHEQSWFPNSLRDLFTDTLQFVWNYLNFYGPIAPRLRHALQEAGTHQIVDLCSGGGGPWLRLVQDFADGERFPVEICLTDKFPNPKAFEHSKKASNSRLVFHLTPVDAMRVPAALEGFRTLFSSFHHFSPEEARSILQDAVKHQQGVGIFEAPKRDWRTIILTFSLPVMAFALMPFIRPFRWPRIIWTYVIPIIPFAVWFDGVMSCFRAYTSTELLALTRGLSENGYRWEAGEEKKRRLPASVTYLIGYPIPQQKNRTS